MLEPSLTTLPATINPPPCTYKNRDAICGLARLSWAGWVFCVHPSAGGMMGYVWPKVGHLEVLLPLQAQWVWRQHGILYVQHSIKSFPKAAVNVQCRIHSSCVTPPGPSAYSPSGHSHKYTPDMHSECFRASLQGRGFAFVTQKGKMLKLMGRMRSKRPFTQDILSVCLPCF